MRYILGLFVVLSLIVLATRPISSESLFETISQVEDTPDPVSKSTILVDNASDKMHNDGACKDDVLNDCSLRDAITRANKDNEVHSIRFAGSYNIKLGNDNNHQLPLPPIDTPMEIVARLDQEIQIDAQGYGPVFIIKGIDITISGLRLYNSGEGRHVVRVEKHAHNIIIKNNIIGDNDKPIGGCHASPQSGSGIYIDAANNLPEGKTMRAQIYNNLIECNGLSGIYVHGERGVSGYVMIGLNQEGEFPEKFQNIIHSNGGLGIFLEESAQNALYYNSVYDNAAGDINSNRSPNNELMKNKFGSNLQ